MRRLQKFETSSWPCFKRSQIYGMRNNRSIMIFDFIDYHYYGSFMFWSVVGDLSLLLAKKPRWDTLLGTWAVMPLVRLSSKCTTDDTYSQLWILKSWILMNFLLRNLSDRLVRLQREAHSLLLSFWPAAGTLVKRFAYPKKPNSLKLNSFPAYLMFPVTLAPNSLAAVQTTPPPSWDCWGYPYRPRPHLGELFALKMSYQHGTLSSRIRDRNRLWLCCHYPQSWILIWRFPRSPSPRKQQHSQNRRC